jgi:mono/diheme cytochrome c family protein
MLEKWGRGVMNWSPGWRVWMVLGLGGLLLAGNSARGADEATVKLYQTKCASCHAADGSGNSVVGKALKVKDLRDPEVQKASDADLATLIAKGKDKMPTFEKTLKAEEIKGLVAYVRELAKK